MAVLEAASCSPTAAHRLQSLGVLFAETVSQASEGQPDATAADLPSLLQEVTDRMPAISHLEDYVPPDPRSAVLVRWRGELFRLMPGSLERPVAMIERARIVAAAIDTALVEVLGFSLRDICELILRRVNSAAMALATVWGQDRADVPGAPATITEAELALAKILPSLAHTVASCSDPARTAAALAWATTNRLHYHPSAATATFGTALAVHDEFGAEPIPIPTGFWIDALDMIINELATVATLDRGGAGRRHGAHRMRRPPALVPASRSRRRPRRFCSARG